MPNLSRRQDWIPARFSPQMNPAKWPELREELIRVFKTKTRDEWCAIMEGSDVCLHPSSPIVEAHKHPHNQGEENLCDH